MSSPLGAVAGFGAVKLSRCITLGRPSEEPLVDFGLNPGDATIAYRHWLGELASLAFTA